MIAPGPSTAGDHAMQAAELPLVLKALQSIPAFRGKSRIARSLLSSTARHRCTLIHDRYGNPMIVPNLAEPVAFSLGLDGAYEPDLVELRAPTESRPGLRGCRCKYRFVYSCFGWRRPASPRG